MDCPKCLGILEKKKMENIEVDVCPICEGIWFDAGELKAVIEADAKDFTFIDVGKEMYDGKEAQEAGLDLDKEKGKCPRCDDKTYLERTSYEKKQSVNIDLCPKGHGIWLDGGEIQDLRKRGLVNLKDWFDNEMDFLKYAFSKNGFGDFLRKIGIRK